MDEVAHVNKKISSETILSLKNKDERALKKVIDLYGDELYRLAYVYLKDKALAEDVVQSVFIKVYYKIQQFNEDSSLYTWIYRITINQCKSKLRKWHYKNIIYTDELPDKDGGNNTTKKVIKKEAEKELYLHILKLDLKYRMPLLCFYYNDFSIKETAEILNEKENTIKTRLYRARKKLKKYILNYKEEG